MEQITVIKDCYHSCPFWANSMDGMYCDHPYWDDKEGWDNMIIDQDNSRDGKIPPLCPLRREDLVIKYQLALGK